MPVQEHVTTVQEHITAGSRTQEICAYGGAAFMAVCGIGLFALCGFVPPPPPSSAMEATAEIFRADSNTLRLGLVVMVFGPAFLAPFIAVISVQMKRIEGPESPLAYVQLILGACLIIEFILPMMALQTAAYRPGRAPEVMQALSDWGWMTFYGVTCTAVLEAVVIGIVILQDRRADAIFPRWAGYLNIWVGMLFSPGALLVFFKSGPLAWDGLFVFWIPFGTFFVWISVMTVLLVKAIRRRRTDRNEPALAVDRDHGEQLAVHSHQLGELHEEVGRLRELLDRHGAGTASETR